MDFNIESGFSQKPCGVPLSKKHGLHRCARMGLFTDSLLLLRCLPLGFRCAAGAKDRFFRMRRVVWENVTRWACLVCEKSVEIREICGRQLSAQCAKEQAECIYSPTDPADFHRCHADWWGLNGFPHYETRAISFSPRNRLAAFSPYVYDKKLLEFVRVQQLHYRFIRYQIPSLAQVA